MIGVIGPGTYAFSDVVAVNARDGETPSRDWSSWYTDKNGKNVHAGGMVTITSGGITPGKPLEGRVDGELLRVVGIDGAVERISIYGTFGMIVSG